MLGTMRPSTRPDEEEEVVCLGAQDASLDLDHGSCSGVEFSYQSSSSSELRSNGRKKGGGKKNRDQQMGETLVAGCEEA